MILNDINALKDELAARASEMEELRAMPSDLAEKIAVTNAFRLLTPKTIGGPELGPSEFMQCLEVIAIPNAAAA